MWAEQTWESVARRIERDGLLRDIGIDAFEVFRFLVTNSIRRGPGAFILEEPDDRWTLHVLLDATMIGEHVRIPEPMVRDAVDILIERGWVERVGNNGNSILILGAADFYDGPDCTQMNGFDLLFTEKVPVDSILTPEQDEKIAEMCRKARENRR